jgi:NAD(P)-dependent dehydrogenase (short-subunit alcohol dehydrogenase family)
MKASALVVGAAGGVGAEVTKALLDADYRVTGTVLSQEEETALHDAVPGLRRIVRLDLADASSVAATLRSLFGPRSKLNAVVVCAAISPYGPLETSSLPALRRTLEINTVSNLAIYQACLPALRVTEGRLVFISSFAGRVALPFVGHYVASKFALEGLGDVMRREASKWKVKVVLVEPGGIQTRMITDQTATLKRDIAALDTKTAKLYGDLYRQFAALNAASYDVAMPPREVARVIVSAVTSRRPKARYVVGGQARSLFELNHTLSETSMDRVIRSFYATSGAEG